MNVNLLKAKRIEHGLYQRDLAAMLHITEKSMCKKECSKRNLFKADEMLILAKELNLSLADFNAIFFNSDLPFV